MSESSLVLRRGTPMMEAVELVRPAITELNQELGASWFYSHLRELPDGVRGMVWEDPALSLGTITLTEDPTVPTFYVSWNVVPRVRRLVMEVLRRHVEPVPVSELQDDAERGHPSRTTALIRLGMGENRLHDERTLQLLVAGLESPGLEVRRAAMTAIFLLKWSAFAPLLKKALARETDESFREQLDLTLELCQGAILV